MKRALLFLIVAASLGGTLAADAAPLPIPRLGAEVTQRFAVARAMPRLDLLLLPRGVLEEVVRWQCGFRDLAYGAASRLAALASAAQGPGQSQGQVTIPDLSILTTEPIANSESSGFGWRDDPFHHRAKFHSGTDFRGKRGAPVLAAGDGVVKSTSWIGGYGNIVQIDHGGGVVTAYAHLSRFLVRPGAIVTAGQSIAAVGATGRATGPHLHFEVRLDGRPVDPNLAMTIAKLRREMPLAGQLASYALSPELQSGRLSAHDPPRQPLPQARQPSQQGKAAVPAKRDARPERPGRVKIAKPVS
jgi:murein DD-endopeptidase MepM/ murein hydrolase activator NlpD